MHELGGCEEQQVPFARRGGLRQCVACGRGPGGLHGAHVSRLRQGGRHARRGSGGCVIACWRGCQSACTQGPRHLKARAHLPRARPRRGVQRVAIGRDAAIQRLGQPLQPRQCRVGAGQHSVAMGQAQARQRIVHRVPKPLAERCAEFWRVEQRFQHCRDVAVGAFKAAGQGLQQRGRRVVSHQKKRDLARDEARGGRRAGQAVQRLVYLGQAFGAQRLAEQRLGLPVMPLGVELEQAVAHVVAAQRGLHARWLVTWRPLRHAHAGQHAGQLLHVLLAVAAVHAQRVQLHQLARVVLVDAACGVLRVVQVAQHGRVARGGAQQVAKAAQCMGANRAFLVVTHQGAQVALAGKHVEVVHPEPGHLLAQLGGRIERAQHKPGGRLLLQGAHVLLPCLECGLALVFCRQGLSGAVACFHVGRQRLDGGARDGHGVDLRLGLAR